MKKSAESSQREVIFKPGQPELPAAAPSKGCTVLFEVKNCLWSPYFGECFVLENGVPKIKYTDRLPLTVSY